VPLRLLLLLLVLLLLLLLLLLKEGRGQEDHRKVRELGTTERLTGTYKDLGSLIKLKGLIKPVMASLCF
jgi:hypothetical protein